MDWSSTFPLYRRPKFCNPEKLARIASLSGDGKNKLIGSVWENAKKGVISTASAFWKTGSGLDFKLAAA